MLRLLVFGSLLLGVVHSQSSIALNRLCNSQVNCRECIIANPSCEWCADTGYNGTTRCYARGDPAASQCAMPQRPEGQVNNTVTPPLEGFTQLSPSRIELSIRPGQPQSFPLNVRPARNFPVDLYLLMDLSFSMNDDLANLKRLGAQLAQRIVGLSSNFTIGFGSFVEKVVDPFTTLDPRYRNDPCFQDGCEATYSYRHVISLTNDSSRFNALVQAQNISGNQDIPEGGFDGFLQSILCTDLIGWRDVSRKLLLFITDAGFHFAGDGKLGGVVRPHQSICRLPNAIPSGQSHVNYNDAEVYDYPSVGQIAQALREEEIIPIFAAVSSVRNFYAALAQEIGEGAFTGILAADSSNVVNLVEELYNTISQRVIFDQEPVPGVSVVVEPVNCPPPGFIADGICNGLEIEALATFRVNVSITECSPELTNQRVTVPVRVVGFGSFEIVVSAICSCPCEANMEPNSTMCSGNGTLSCGQCVCNEGNFGEMCQCDASNQGAQLECPLGSNNQQCTGRGTCICGECNCQSGFFGATCECDQRDCLNENNGQICSGRGTCGCNGNCMCNVEPVSGLPYNGPRNLCECTPNTQNCRDPFNRTSICNGRGVCGCEGTCECQSPYFGEFCELCSGAEICFASNCDANRECANCALNFISGPIRPPAQIFFTNATVTSGPLNGSTLILNPTNNALEIRVPEGRCTACANGAVIINGTERTDYIISGDPDPAVRCELTRDLCTYRYFYAIDESTNDFTAVHVEYIRSCPLPNIANSGPAPWVIAISILIPLLVLGILALILLKVLLLIFDYIEVRKFEKDLAKTKYSKNENPLYRSAAKDYENPLYGQ